MMNESASSSRILECVALLGRRDEPTDAVETYCRYLAEALSSHRIRVLPVRLAWSERGWPSALASLQDKLSGNPPDLAILQYTALGWSRRGFPLRFLRLLHFLKKNNVRCGVVFHDAGPYEGRRLVDRLRRRVQRYVMRAAAREAELTILTVPAKQTPWLPTELAQCVSIPVGANLPCAEAERRSEGSWPPTVAVFSVTGGATGEVRAITDAVRYASSQFGELRLVVFGRHAEDFERLFREELAGSKVQLSIQGLVEGAEIVRILSEASAFLFVRGHIPSRRGSAIAGIACGLPVIARQGWETGPPITEAGVVLLPPDADGRAFGAALVRVLSDKDCAAALAKRSSDAYARYFSWRAIAAQYAAALRSVSRQP